MNQELMVSIEVSTINWDTIVILERLRFDGFRLVTSDISRDAFSTPEHRDFKHILDSSLSCEWTQRFEIINHSVIIIIIGPFWK